MLAVSPLTAFAQGGVTYRGQKDGLVLSSGTSTSSDLFPAFKGIMPGDEKTESIKIKNGSKEKVRIYMRSMGAESDSAKLLEKLQLSVRNGKTEVAQGSAAVLGKLTDWTLLGELAPGESRDLTVTLKAPIELDNAYQDVKGVFEWQFKVEELGGNNGDKDKDKDKDNDKDKDTDNGGTPRPTEPSGGTATDNNVKYSNDYNPVKTGDDSPVVLYGVLVAAAAVGVILTATLRLRRR